MKDRKKENGYVYDAETADDGEVRHGGLQIIARIVCLILAFSIWLYVIDNDSDDYEKTFTLIPVEVEGSETLAELNKMSVINLEESAVSVTVRGKRSNINTLTSEDFRAYINVGGITTADRHLMPVLVDLPVGVEKINTEPSAVNIYTDELASREIPVEVVPHYRIDASYTIASIEKDRETVTVSGPRSLLERIAAARAEIDLGTITTGVVATGVLEAVDKDGLPVDAKYLRLDVRDITVSLGIYIDKIVQLAVETAPGFPSEYYRGAMISPISVTLRGDPKLVEGIDKLVVLTLTTDAKDRYTVKLTDSLLPAGVSFVDAPENVDISLSFAEKPADTEPADEDMP